jgi:hypothetical protein
MRKGIKLIEEVVGTGPPLYRGCRTQTTLRIWLNMGEELPIQQSHQLTWSRRDLVGGIFQAMEGMCEGGSRKVRISPHLMYRGEGVQNKVPPDAVLTVLIVLERVFPSEL